MMLLLILFFINIAQATELTFGPEFTVSNQRLLETQPTLPPGANVNWMRRNFYFNPYMEEKYNQLVELLKKRLIEEKPRGKRFRFYHNNYDGERRLVIVSRSGWQATLGVDPSVFEWTTNPMTLKQYKKFEKEIQEVVFDIPKEIGLEPAMFTGGGHVNVGLGAFWQNRLHMRNFIVDLLNHSELFLGVLNYDNNNALSPWLLKPVSFSKIESVLAIPKHIVDQVEIGDYMLELTNSFHSYTTDEYLDYFRPEYAPFRQMRGAALAFCFRGSDLLYRNRRLDAWRIEMRSVRPQTSVKVFIKQIELLQARVNYLSRFNEYIPVENRLPLFLDRRFFDRLYDPPVDPQAALQAFYEYVTQSGLRWEDHQEYLWPRWISSGELAKFNENLSKNREQSVVDQTNCQQLLK